MSNFCKNCGSQIKDSQKFCSECGLNVDDDENFIFCSKCGEKSKNSQKFCDKCGSKLENNQIREEINKSSNNFTTSNVLAIIGSISGILISSSLIFLIIFIQAISNSEGTALVSAITILSPSIAALIGIYLVSIDEKVAILQYVVCGLFTLLTISFFGIIPAILFFLAALFIYLRRNPKIDKKEGWNDLYSIPIFSSLIFCIMLIIGRFII